MTTFISLVVGAIIVAFVLALCLIGIAALVLIAVSLAMPLVWLWQVFVNTKEESS